MNNPGYASTIFKLLRIVDIMLLINVISINGGSVRELEVERYVRTI